MTIEEICLQRLSNQRLLAPCSVEETVRGLCGLQAQFFSNALHALRIRCGHEPTAAELAPLLKTWTLRGTLHLVHERDLPLFLHEGRTHFLRPCDTMDSDERLSAGRKRFFSALIARKIAEGMCERDALREACFATGMTETEASSAFDAWGGLIRAMCEAGEIGHAPQQKKAFRLCPPFVPMARGDARRELLRRYLLSYGPVSLRDASYFFGAPQREISPLLEALPVRRETCGSRNYFSLSAPAAVSTPPDCVFLAGFDPLMMGYEKKENPFLPEQALRGVFNRAGIVMPPLLLEGRVVGRWKRSGRKIQATLFETVPQRGKRTICEAAQQCFGEGIRCEFPE